jgi:transcriptional regulator GlxA family with amidase domain
VEELDLAGPLEVFGVAARVAAGTHWNALTLLRQYPAVTIVDDERVVRDGPIRTSAGVSAGIDIAPDVVDEPFGEKTARKVAHVLEYPRTAGDHDEH